MELWFIQAAYELMKEAKEAACDLFTNVTKQLIDETPRRSQELCLVRKVNKHYQ